MSNIVEVAKHARVSTATVSNVIRGTHKVSSKLQERVNKAIKELDYHPNELARSLKVKQTRMLGMVLPDITNPFFPEIMRGAEDRAFDRGYFLLTANTDEQIEREQKIVSALRSYRVDGILLASAPGKNVSHIQRTIEANICVVCIDRTVRGIKTDSVLLDNVQGGKECTRHLIDSGYRRIAIITGPLQLQTARERLKGYEQAHREAGIMVSPKLIFEGDFRADSGYLLGKQILASSNRPPAILVCNGVMALGVLRALEEMKLTCPDDIAIATFDDLAVDRPFRPHLTSVVQPSYEIGAQAASILIDRIEGRLIGPPVSVRIHPALLTRESSRPRPRKVEKGRKSPVSRI